MSYFRLTSPLWAGYGWHVARKVRIQYPGAIYHVMNRGDRREAIFADDDDRRRFLETLGQACEKTGWLVHAYCLMSTHFHLVIETPQPNLVTGMKWLLGTYTGRYNRRHQEFGHLFSGRYKALLVDGGGNGYLKTLCDYVHLNPARAKMLRSDQPLTDFAWTSFGNYLTGVAQRPAWLRVDRLLGEWGIPKDSASGRRVFAERMEGRRQQDLGKEFKAIDRGWCLGGEEFRRELLEQVKTQPGPSHFGDAIQEADEARAERLTLAGLGRLGWTERDVETRRKGDPKKVALAIRLRSQTTMPLSWIAHRLRMGTRGYLAWLLQQQKGND
jgi:REP element-mobilizing transposase RayT